MVPIISLWLPILLSAVLVFVVSVIIHMFLTYHRNDFRKLPKEDELMAILRRLEIPPGDYMMPYASSTAEMKSPGFIEKRKAGPVVIMTVAPGGPPSMTGSLILWFLYLIIVGIFAAYISGRALPTGAAYSETFQFAGCTAFIGYSLALIPNSIWYKRKWVATAKSVFDGLVYGLLTGGMFGWLWPS